jgi:hypothetical protein
MVINQRIRRLSGYAFVILFMPLGSQAGPMGFQGSWMTMGDLGPNWREVFINYAVTARDAIGAAQTYMRADDNDVSADLTELTYTRLLHRWNRPDAQANLWFAGGVGAIRESDRADHRQSNKIAASPGIQADYETTRVYVSAMYKLYRAAGINHDYAAVRAGFSFFEPHYERIHPWLIVEARAMHDLSDKLEITPMLRLIHRAYFVEVGANNFGQPRLNFMLIF